MRIKRYKGRHHWHNATLWSTASAVMLGVGGLFTAATGRYTLLFALTAIAFIGMVVSVVRDRSVRCHYVLNGDVLLLHSQNSADEVPIAQVQDASLVEQAAARDYILQKLRKAREEGLDREIARQREEAYIRYCSVDIGLHSFWSGIFRRVMGNTSDVRTDLVLLRLRNGQDHLLSPVYNQDLVSALSRQIHAGKSAQRSRPQPIG